LYAFAQKNALTSGDRQWFNTLAILFSALVSLSVGPLLRFLGTMIRWPAHLISRLFQVDLILGTADLVGSIHLAWCYTKEWRWTRIMMIVLLYLLHNVGGRLSVATFGLTFDLNEFSGIEYPIVVANWNAS
ncbi:hypothetical protein B0T25DRAFT_455920, partial [Lasiosphaeria hispida]